MVVGDLEPLSNSSTLSKENLAGDTTLNASLRRKLPLLETLEYFSPPSPPRQAPASPQYQLNQEVTHRVCTELIRKYLPLLSRMPIL